jgi:hypothetical protein
MRLTPRAASLGSAAVVLVWPAVARADMVWPGLLLEHRLLTWWAVGAGLALEAAYLWWRVPASPKNGPASIAG